MVLDTVITIVNYDCHMFIIQATGETVCSDAGVTFILYCVAGVTSYSDTGMMLM
jgi:hypothetical protein